MKKKTLLGVKRHEAVLLETQVLWIKGYLLNDLQVISQWHGWLMSYLSVRVLLLELLVSTCGVFLTYSLELLQSVKGRLTLVVL